MICWGLTSCMFHVLPENGYASTDEEPSEFSQASDSRWDCSLLAYATSSIHNILLSPRLLLLSAKVGLFFCKKYGIHPVKFSSETIYSISQFLLFFTCLFAPLLSLLLQCISNERIQQPRRHQDKGTADEAHALLSSVTDERCKR